LICLQEFRYRAIVYVAISQALAPDSVHGIAQVQADYALAGFLQQRQRLILT
jgi:hypothetical protein